MFALSINPCINAAYAFKRNWTALSKLPKKDLLEGYQHWVQRIVHRETKKLEMAHSNRSEYQLSTKSPDI
jgi:hypothetical protein